MPQGAARVTRNAEANAIDLDAFREELRRAREHVAQLEDQYREALEIDRRTRHAAPRLDESPAVARACNAALWAVVALPFVLAAVMLVERAIG